MSHLISSININTSNITNSYLRDIIHKGFLPCRNICHNAYTNI